MTREEIEQIVEIAVRKGIAAQGSFSRSQESTPKRSARDAPVAETKEEARMLNLFRKLSEERKTAALGYLMGMLAAQRVDEETGLE